MECRPRSLIPLPSTSPHLKKIRGKKNPPRTFNFLKFNLLNHVGCCIILKPKKELQSMYLGLD